MFDTVLNLKAVEAKVTSRGQLKHGRGGKNIMNREISEKEESYEVLTEDNDSGLLKKKKKNMNLMKMKTKKLGSVVEKGLKFEMRTHAVAIDRFQNAGAAREFIERQHYCKDIRPVVYNPFWHDILTQVCSSITNSYLTPHLLSSNFTHAWNSTFECLLVLSLSNLPFKKQPPVLDTSISNTLKITSNTPLIIYTKTLKEFSSNDKKVESEILLVQKF